MALRRSTLPAHCEHNHHQSSAVRGVHKDGRAVTYKENGMKMLLKNLMNDESGQDLIEYALIAALIALGAIVAMTSLSTKIATEFNTIGSSL
jgi:pilus assembly protein Flp/PilA